MNTTPVNPQMLVELVSVRIPFGKYKNRILCDLPESYLVWFHRKGFLREKSACNCLLYMKSNLTGGISSEANQK